MVLIYPFLVELCTQARSFRTVSRMIAGPKKKPTMKAVVAAASMTMSMVLLYHFAVELCTGQVDKKLSMDKCLII
ncbi:MAG: hypothetical protein EBS53_13105 [Bacteroidetes bacterium]|nr:hypothetical protein [Bacteroidota bacterium]